MHVTLAQPTQAAWLTQALTHLDLVLLDHAQCEKKAANAALKLMFRYPERRALVEALIPLAQEELQHYEWVNRKLDQRQVAWGQLPPPPYGQRLHEKIRRDEPFRLLDTLLISALIECRSHERLALLGAHVADESLRAFYGQLALAEERHHNLYVELALTYFPEVQVHERLTELAAWEGEILHTLYPQPRVHS
jgi:tRNA-(ms[2]io[6]A)-hydroxylase